MVREMTKIDRKEIRNKLKENKMKGGKKSKGGGRPKGSKDKSPRRKRLTQVRDLKGRYI